MDYLKLGFDLDGCLVDFMSTFSAVVKQKYGLNILLNEIRKFRIKHEYLTDDQIKECVRITLSLWDVLESYPWAIRFIKKYYEITKYPPIFITARPDKENTYNWLHKWFKIPFKIEFAGDENGGRKSSKVIKNDIDIFIEDRVKHAIEISSKEKCVWLLKRSWNRHIKENQYIIQVDDWYDIEEMYKGVQQLFNSYIMGVEE